MEFKQTKIVPAQHYEYWTDEQGCLIMLRAAEFVRVQVQF
jgi:hypothetical protein